MASLANRRARLYEAACYCHRGPVCITCLRWRRLIRINAARRAHFLA
jgi:hypothetical protein